MKKLLFILAFMVPVMLYSQGTQTFSKDITIKKTTPTLYLNGSGGIINFNSGDVTLTNSTNTLTLAGGNLVVPNILTGYTTTATAAGTTTLVVGSNYFQYFTGSTTQTVALPVTSTLALGQEFLIVNNSTGLVTVNSSGGNAVIILGASTSARVTCILISGTTAASWSVSYKGIGITSAKKLSVSNTLTLAGTDATTMTFPSTSATIARTDAANTFTGHQTIEGVTSAGATGTNNLVFSTSPTLVTPALGTPSGGVLTSCTGLPMTTGVTGVLAVANGGTNASSASITAFNNITGYTASGATGTTSTNLVFSTSPVLTTPTIGAASATSITIPGGAATVPFIVGTKSNNAGNGLTLVGSTDNTGGVQIFADDDSAVVGSVTSPIWTRYMVTRAQSSGATQTGAFLQLKTKDASTTFTNGSITAAKVYNQAGVVTLAGAAEFGIINAGITLAGEMTVVSGTKFSGIDINLGGVGPVTTSGTGIGAGLIIRNKGEGATWPVDISLQYGETIDNAVDGTIAISGIVSAEAGIELPTESTHIWAAGGSVVLATAGTDVACADGTRFWTELMIPYNVTLTGLSYLVGSVGGTDSVVVQLVNSAGVQVATSRAVGEAADIVGTAAQIQSVAFTSTYAATAGLYYAVFQFNGTTAKFRAYPITGSKFIAGSVGGTWLTAAGITPGTTFTADKGPICITY